MKKISVLLVLLLMAGMNSFAQKKNGTVYSEHETIETTRQLWQAAVNGDEKKFRSFFADSAYIMWHGKPAPKTANADIGKGTANWAKGYENLKVSDHKPAFPDAIEYKDGGLWVQDWLLLTGIHKETGIVLDLPVHNLYAFNEEGKITLFIRYFENDVFEEIANSTTKKENGKVYINHPYIVNTRKAMNAFVSGDMDKLDDYFSQDARFSTTMMPLGESTSLSEYKENIKKMFHSGNLTFKVEQIGYPDCIYYAKNDGYVVYSWWKMSVTKGDEKAEFGYMLSHDYNDEGKIVRENVYVSSNQLDIFRD
jgi:hypothetical protein